MVAQYSYPAYPETNLATNTILPSGPVVPIIPNLPSNPSYSSNPTVLAGAAAASARLHPVVYQDDYGNEYTWQHGSPWVPAGFVPLPPSPSGHNHGYLTPSPYASPWATPSKDTHPLPAVPIVPTAQLQPTVYYPQYPQVDPYYGSRPPVYFPPGHVPPPQIPRFQIQNLLKKDSAWLLVDLSASVLAPVTPNGRNNVVPVHPGYLDQPATTPALPWMTITCPDLAPYNKDWTFTVVEPQALPYAREQRCVTIADILSVTHAELRKPITHEEWTKLPEKDVYDVSVAFRKRCRNVVGSEVDRERERNQGVRRCDFLREKILFSGISQVKEGDGTMFQLHVRTVKK